MGLLPNFLETGGGEKGLFKAFRAAGLPIQTLDNPNMPIPVAVMAELFAQAGAILDDRTLGFRVGRDTNYQGWGGWAQYGTQAPTLGTGINRLNATNWAHMSAFEMTLQPVGRGFVWRVVPPLRQDRIMHYTDHLLFPMLSYARLYLGRTWVPEWIEVNYPRDREAQVIETLLQAPLRCGGNGVALPFSAEQLARKHPEGKLAALQALTLKDIAADVVLPEAQEPARSFSAIVAMRLLEGKSDIEGAAQTVGCGVRGLQRRLSTAGYTYKDILEAARRTRALELLAQTSVSVAEIAFSLGYEEHANFSRAFQRWMGISPSAYRAKFGIDRPRTSLAG